MNDQNWSEQKAKWKETHRMWGEKKQPKMLVNGRQREVHVHKVNGLELRERIASASENIHWSIPYTTELNRTEQNRTYIHITSIHIQAPFYLWPFILRTTHWSCVCVCVSRWMWTCICVGKRFLSTLFRTSLARIGHKNLLIEVYRTKYAWLHSVRSLAHQCYILFVSFRVPLIQMLQFGIRSCSIFRSLTSLLVVYLFSHSSICLSLLSLMVMCFFECVLLCLS